MTMHPQIIKKDGKKEFVILPYGEYLAIQEILEDFSLLKELRKEKKESKNKPTLSLEKVIKSF